MPSLSEGRWQATEGRLTDEYAVTYISRKIPSGFQKLCLTFSQKPNKIPPFGENSFETNNLVKRY